MAGSSMQPPSTDTDDPQPDSKANGSGHQRRRCGRTLRGRSRAVSDHQGSTVGQRVPGSTGRTPRGSEVDLPSGGDGNATAPLVHTQPCTPTTPQLSYRQRAIQHDELPSTIQIQNDEVSDDRHLSCDVMRPVTWSVWSHLMLDA